jgi:hypothetical protein
MSKKKMPKNMTMFRDEIYGIDYLIIITPKHEKFRKLMKEYLDIEIEKDDDDCGGQFQGFHNKEKGDLGVIWCVNKKYTLVHEIFHATSWAMRSRDITMDSEGSEESYAYYMAYLYREIKDRLS